MVGYSGIPPFKLPGSFILKSADFQFSVSDIALQQLKSVRNIFFIRDIERYRSKSCAGDILEPIYMQPLTPSETCRSASG